MKLSALVVMAAVTACVATIAHVAPVWISVLLICVWAVLTEAKKP